MISKIQLEKYKELLQVCFGESVGDEEVLRRATALLSLYAAIREAISH